MFEYVQSFAKIPGRHDITTFIRLNKGIGNESVQIILTKLTNIHTKKLWRKFAPQRHERSQSEMIEINVYMILFSSTILIQTTFHQLRHSQIAAVFNSNGSRCIILILFISLLSCLAFYTTFILNTLGNSVINIISLIYFIL